MFTEIGATQDLTETILPASASNKQVSWSSNNAAVATVDANGLVTARADGSAKITVTTADGNFRAVSNITVAATPAGSLMVIEAENLNATGGTYNDGFA